MDKYAAVNKILVSLFNDIMDMEQKAIITEEYKDISSNDMHIIEAIGIQAPRNMSTIASILKVTVGTLTIAINNLVKKGYVKRTRSEIDRRVVFISLSAKGKRAFKHHEAFHNRMTDVILRRLDEQEVDILLKSLENISDYFRLEQQ